MDSANIVIYYDKNGTITITISGEKICYNRNEKYWFILAKHLVNTGKSIKETCTNRNRLIILEIGN